MVAADQHPAALAAHLLLVVVAVAVRAVVEGRESDAAGCRKRMIRSLSTMRIYEVVLIGG
jgi:hypothetical protein